MESPVLVARATREVLVFERDVSNGTALPLVADDNAVACVDLVNRTNRRDAASPPLCLELRCHIIVLVRGSNRAEGLVIRSFAFFAAKFAIYTVPRWLLAAFVGALRSSNFRQCSCIS